MTSYTLFMLEIGGIQDFIFSSNNLRINASSSALVTAIGYQWLPQLLNELGYSHNIGEGQVKPAAIEDNDVDVEAIYVGGGNAFLIFPNDEAANKLLEQFSTRLLVQAPDLHAVAAMEQMTWHNNVLVDKHKTLRETLVRRKAQVPPNRPLPGRAVTAACAFTGQPATEIWYDQPIAYSIEKRLPYLEYANRYLLELVPELEEVGLEQVTDFDNFGNQDESGYIAIVHADGNRMGERIEALSKGCKSPDKNRQYANKLRAFSNSARKAAQEALRGTVTHLLQTMHRDEDGNWCWRRRASVPPAARKRMPKVVLAAGEEADYLPFRAIVFGGDDVTFVCDGRLGLALAQRYLTVYAKQAIADDENEAVGRAGIAIVHAHFPFALGYELAESLASSAKTQGDDGKVASIDWHFGVNGLIYHRIKDIRDDDYTVKFRLNGGEKEMIGRLHSRPVRLVTNNDWRNWDVFDKLVEEFQISDAWRQRRNKVKALQAVLRDGPIYTEAFLTNFQLPDLPAAPNVPSEAVRQGWSGDTCVYFDALEALDFHVPLETIYDE